MASGEDCWYCHSCAASFYEAADVPAVDVTCSLCGEAFVERVPNPVPLTLEPEPLQPRYSHDEEESDYDDEGYDDDEGYEDVEGNVDEEDGDYGEEGGWRRRRDDELDEASYDHGGGGAEYSYDEAAALDEIFFNFAFFDEISRRGGEGAVAAAVPPPATGASEAAIQALPSVGLTTEGVAAEPECAICNEDFEVGELVTELGCKHHYHRHCIADWLQRQNSCPVCRWVLPHDDGATNTSELATESPSSASGTAVAASASASLRAARGGPVSAALEPPSPAQPARSTTGRASSPRGPRALSSPVSPAAASGGAAAAPAGSSPLIMLPNGSSRLVESGGWGFSTTAVSGRSSASNDGGAGGGRSNSGAGGFLARLWRGMGARGLGVRRLSSGSAGESSPSRSSGGFGAVLHQVILSPSQVLTVDGEKGFFAYGSSGAGGSSELERRLSGGGVGAGGGVGSPASRLSRARTRGWGLGSPPRAPAASPNASEQPAAAGGTPQAGDPGTPSAITREAQDEQPPPSPSLAAAEPALVWISAVSIVPTHMKRRVCVAYKASASGGRVLYSRDVPKNQQAAERAHRGFARAQQEQRRRQQQQHAPPGVAGAGVGGVGAGGIDVS